MLRVCITTLGGAYAVGLCRTLPDWPVAVLVAAAGLLCAAHHRSRIAGAFAAGFVLTWCASTQLMVDRLAPAAHGRELSIRVQIADFVEKNGSTARFIAAIGDDNGLPSRIRLSWIDAERTPQIAETWDLQVRLRQPRGFSNAYGFDYEGWLFRNGIGATGYVVAGELSDAASAAPFLPTLRLRAGLAQRLSALLPADDASAVLLAITVGARHRISSESWARYARTGTSHLMAISGLHIGLAAGGALIITWFFLSLVSRRGNLRDLSLLVAMPAACTYALIAGLAIPAQRAALMTIIATAAVLFRRPVIMSRQLSLACFAGVIVNPVSVFAPGFMMSFAAVAILLICGAHLRAANPVQRGPTAQACAAGIGEFWKLQLALLLGLFALTAVLFERVAWLAPIVNIVVLPVFSLICVPLSLAGLLLGGVLHPLGDQLLIAAYHSVRLVLLLVNSAAALPFADLPLRAVRGPIALTAILASLHIAAPPGWPGRRLAWVALLAVVLYKPPAPPPGCMDLHVLDVGQGLTVLLRSHRHTILFDTGPAFRSGSDTAALVTVPHLDALGIRQIDLLVVSHGDLDHAGGVDTLLLSTAVVSAIAGEPHLHTRLAAERCHSGQSWQFDGIDIAVIHPHAGAAWTGNNASCVLSIRLGRHRILLTGDIESPVENMLAAELPMIGTVVVPHHGSNTSSSRKFVAALRPDNAIVSAGYANRWQFPKPAVVERWQSVGSNIHTTADDGEITQRYCRGTAAGPIGRHRKDRKRLWHMAGES